ncbi:MAG: beta-glucosidase [Rhodothermales bacterium]|nr:beta-glucosidase [Rhodothermales bacterium]
MRFIALLGMMVMLSSCVDQYSDSSVTEPMSQAVFVSFDAQVDELLARMTVDEKIGQMTQPDQEFLEDVDHIRDYMFGSLLSGGGSDPETNSLEDWRALYERYQAKALETRLAIPLLYGVDAVHGHSNVIGAVVFPHNIGLGATRNAELVEEISRITAKEVKATGMNWDFAPCVAVPRDDRWGRTYEGFAEEPMLVAELGAAAVRGLQGDDLSDPTRVLACAKHLAGDGGTVIGTGVTLWDGSTYPFDRGDVPLSEEELRRIHMEGYVTAVKAGVGTIMPSYSSWNGVKCSGSRRLLTEIIKEELGFEGFLISDFKAIDELPGDYKSDIETSINAGMDMVMVPDRYQLFFDTLKELVEEGGVPMERIDDAVRRILRVKFAAGLFDEDWSPTADRALEASVGSDEHRAVARQAVRESLVLLKNEGGLLPLAKDVGRIHVVGVGADNIGMQSGGWTIDWQGGMGAITPGTTILEAIRSAVSDGTEVTYSADGSGAEGADVVIAVVGERPYAEMYGDDLDLELSSDDDAVVSSAAKAGVPVVTLLISGRPMIADWVMDASEAFMAIWLPGSEGDGIADVLFGDHAPTGKLSFTWPRSVDQHPINVGDENYDPLFEFGYGLTW